MIEKAVFGGGCFWCTEAVFRRLRGVAKVESGYAGGARPHPTYDQVSTGVSGHAEVVQLHFEPSVISYAQLLEVFWHVHDPTTLNKQGADVGTQYRSVILTTSEQQQQLAERSRAALQKSGEYSAPIVTKIEPLQTFYRAEEYHQRFYEQNPATPYCQLVIDPKIETLLKRYGNLIQHTVL